MEQDLIDNRKMLKNIAIWQVKHPGKKLDATKKHLQKERLFHYKNPHYVNWDKYEVQVNPIHKEAKEKLKKIEELEEL